MSGRTRRTRETRVRLAQEMKTAYYAGASIRALAKEYDCAFGTARNLLLLAGTRLRRRGGGLPRPIPVEEQTAGGGK